MNKTEFQQQLTSSGKPMILYFRADWCAPCRVTKPILEKLAGEFSDEVEFVRINADDSRELLEQFQVHGIPTVITLRDGRETGRVSGAQNEAGYRSMFEALAEGREVRIPLSPVNRLLRLGGGAILIMIGIGTGNPWVGMFGALLAFLGVYDRCPIWNVIAGMFRAA